MGAETNPLEYLILSQDLPLGPLLILLETDLSTRPETRETSDLAKWSQDARACFLNSPCARPQYSLTHLNPPVLAPEVPWTQCLPAGREEEVGHPLSCLEESSGFSSVDPTVVLSDLKLS
jgi:hypothetical protein